MNNFFKFENSWQKKFVMSPQGLNLWAEHFGGRRNLVQHEDLFGNDPQLVSGSLRSCSAMFSERFRIVNDLLDSDKFSQV